MVAFFLVSLDIYVRNHARGCANIHTRAVGTMSRPLVACCFLLILLQLCGSSFQHRHVLSRLRTDRALIGLNESASVQVYPQLLGLKWGYVGYVTVKYQRSFGASNDDWIGVFSPSKFNASACLDDYNGPNREYPPNLCTAPIKFQNASASPDYVSTGIGQIAFRLINQRSDFVFALFTGVRTVRRFHRNFFHILTLFFGWQPVLIAVSSPVTFAHLKMPLYPRLAQGQSWNEMTVTWTSGYRTSEAIPFVSYEVADHIALHKIPSFSPASTLSLSRGDMCGPPASTVGWRDPGQIHTGSMKDLLPNTRYSYRVGHKLSDNSVVMSPIKYFKSPPFPGEESLQRVVIFGDLGKHERDGSMMYDDFQFGSLNTTDTITKEIDNIDIIFHIGDLSYATGYISQWDQFTEQIEGMTSRVPYMTASGNHERDWPNSGSYYNTTDSGGECGVLSSTVFNMPVKNREKFWYSTDYGLLHFCIADSEHDWRKGSEQYKWIEECLASADRQKQPWLIFIAHRVLGYSSWYVASENTTAEPFSRESLQGLWQKYKVDIAFYGHVHNYERSCPVYDEVCVSNETNVYSGKFNATIHVVAGGAGASLTPFPSPTPAWSMKRDYDYGYTKITAFNRSSLLFEYKKSSDGQVYDSFWIHREFKDVLGCDAENVFCPQVTSAI
ncbi:nucleotide pyrophosphatase/phosphodiesterase isoform X1 [Selaginella moellendorffii]|uniref:nucleotide pyrophosphatase/phosphodiesterase isoform X1 n=2 Tax=Selaginella moellendorffii TaxID=88036 RepID=UPI000D1C7289|nr:nucleotide pyrophosphatase/phosphodiesterase isoform X1 [Selaginella moellendorffii]|eukprot:XP_024537154.1 nucleotide pyrophosphatase/phosphodiesterase isoform X1 [Selaginella moellendorffii]